MASDPTAEPAIGSRLLNIRDAAEYLGCCQANLYALIAGGELPIVRVGTRKGYRLDRRDLDAFIDRRKETSVAVSKPPTPRRDLKHIRLPR